MKNILLFLILSFCFQLSFGSELIVKIVDVGNGFGCLIKTPNNKYLVYDAGGYTSSSKNVFQDTMSSFIPKGSEIETMFLSHSDADHIGSAGWIINNYKVKRLYRTGLEKTDLGAKKSTKAYSALLKALKSHPKVEDINLNKLGMQLQAGSRFNIGGVSFVFLSGYGETPVMWGKLSKSKKLNSVSLVVRIEYLGKSVMLCGDEVGSYEDKTGFKAEYSEKYMLDLLPDSLLDCDVIIASHHGAENGNSIEFIKKVSPTYVICPAGTDKNGHPRKKLIDRFLDNGVEQKNIFSTDRGAVYEKNGNPHSEEWQGLLIEGCDENDGDDGVDIIISGTKTKPKLEIGYVQKIDPCLK